MHSQHRARGKILFEVFCALSSAASFVSAWDQTASSALLASASIMALFAIYWSFGLFARGRAEDVAQPTAAIADAPVVDVAPQPVAAVAETQEVDVQSVVPEDVFAREPDLPGKPEPVSAKPKKRRAPKAQKAAAVVAPAVERPEPGAIEEPVSDGLHLEQLFDPQPFARQARPAFGRKSRGPRPLSAA